MANKYIYIPDIPAQMLEVKKPIKQLLHNQILFKPLPSEEKTDSGLFVPENAIAVSNKGIIAQVANGTKKRPMKLKEGQVAYRVKDWGNDIMINNELYFLMDENAILATE